MPIDSKPHPAPADSSRRRLLRGATFLLIALALVGFFAVFDFYTEPPDDYQPALGAISDAEEALSATYGNEQELLDRYRSVHRQLDHTIDLLNQVEGLDPADKKQIETLQARLQALEDPQRMAAGDPDQLERSYRDLIRQLNALAERLRQHR